MLKSKVGLIYLNIYMIIYFLGVFNVYMYLNIFMYRYLFVNFIKLWFFIV